MDTSAGSPGAVAILILILRLTTGMEPPQSQLPGPLLSDPATCAYAKETSARSSLSRQGREKARDQIPGLSVCQFLR